MSARHGAFGAGGVTARRAVAAIAALATLAGVGDATAQGVPGAPPPPLSPRLALAHEATLRLDVAEARSLLEGASPDDPGAAVELALLAIYEGDCDGAVALLRRPVSMGQQGAAPLAEIARGCSTVTAGLTWLRDDRRGVWLRFKDSDDAALAPALVDVAERSMAALERDLEVRLPRPLRIEIVRDQYSLAQMTGLPESAAQTTGTVAVAKWGRVILLTPHASPHGFAWADTLMHELTHLAVTRGSRDRAPLWLQEGTAKREETRWRSARPFDALPPPDAIARLGFERGIALPLDRLGPSIAMLPTPEQAMVAFAEVQSFLGYWSREAGSGALARLLPRIADAHGTDPVDAALTDVSGAGLGAWSTRWQRDIAAAPAEIPDDLVPDFLREKGSKGSLGPHGGLRNVYRGARLGELLASRGHHEQAARYHSKTVAAVPHDPSARARLALSLRALGRNDAAARVVERIDDVHSAHAVYFAMRGAALRDAGASDDARAAFIDGLWLSPFDPAVACQALGPETPPSDPADRALCDLARRR